MRIPHLLLFGLLALVLGVSLLWLTGRLPGQKPADDVVKDDQLEKPKLPRFETRPEQYANDPAGLDLIVLSEDFVFYDAKGNAWTAPKGTKSDGASIPQIFLSFLGDRYDKRWRAAAIVHDAYCQEANREGPSYQTRTWEETHRMFYEACREGGTGEQAAQLMLAAVWLQGPRWPAPGENRPSILAQSASSPLDEPTAPEPLTDEELEKCKLFIETKDPSVDELITWMNGREESLRQGVSPPLKQ